MIFRINYRNVEWCVQALSVSGSWITMQVHSHGLPMPASVLEFSLWDATCKQIPDLQLTDAEVELLRPWLKSQGFKWKIGWHRKQRPSRR